ncbi:MAG: efflux system, outer rane lipoprotein NodT family [Nevskia sp.]|nr:efflux system, outer rane lipoprotein NodT family [Nevskia sp.]
MIRRLRPHHWAVPLAACALTILSGCAVGPDFKTPPAPAAERYGNQPLPPETGTAPGAAGAAQAFVISNQLPAQWWQQFGSERLSALVLEAFAGSPSTASAEAALRQAYANYQAQRAGLLPFFDGKADAQRQKINGAAFGTPGAGNFIYNLFDASVNVSYNLDLFGGVRRGVEAQAAQVDYQRFQLEAAYQTLAANVVTSSVTEARLRALLAAQQAIIADEQDTLRITEVRFQAGAVSSANVLTARSNLASDQATLPSLQQQLDQAQNQLAVYLGKAPSERATSNFELSEFTLPLQIPVSLPSELVRQRPDVRAAEAQLHGASANVGVATANMLPQIQLTGSYGVESSKTSNLFDNGVWSIGANITQPLLHFGELSAKRRAALAAYDGAAADYKLTVLRAFQDVANALTALQTDAAALAAQYAAMDAAKASLALSEKQLKLGGISYLDLLTAQQQYQRANTNYLTALAARYADTAALFQALGGGWWNRPAANGTQQGAAAPATGATVPAPPPATPQPSASAS